MNENTNLKVPKWYWIVAVVALLWNLMGSAAFLMELFAQEAMMEGWTDAQKEWAHSIPTWVYFAYGLAIATGLAGSICLLLRNSLAVLFFSVCLPVVLIQMIYTMIIAGGLQAMGPSNMVMPVLVISLAGMFLWFAIFAKQRNWFGAVTSEVE